MPSTIQSQASLVSLETGLNAASVTQRPASEDAFHSNSISLTAFAGPQLLSFGAIVVARQILFKLVSGDSVTISLDGGVLYPLIIGSPGEPVLIGLDSRTVSVITCIADTAGSLGGKYFSIYDLDGLVWVWFDTGTGAGATATGTLTSNNTNVGIGETVTIGSKVYTFRSVLVANTLTTDLVNVSNGDTVTIGSKIYTFQTTLTNVNGNVFIGANYTASLLNLSYAINAFGGTPGIEYAADTIAHDRVTATTPTAATLVITAIANLFSEAGLATSELSTHLVWAAITLGGSGATVPAVYIEGDVRIGTTADQSLTNLSSAINRLGNPDIDYKCAAAHPQVTADAFLTGHAFDIESIVIGTVGNYGTTTSAASLSFGGSTMTGGINSSTAPEVTTQRLLPVVIVSGSPNTVIAAAVSAALHADLSFICSVSAATLTITDMQPGVREAIAAETSGFTSPSQSFTIPATVWLKSAGTSQVAVAIAPA